MKSFETLSEAISDLKKRGFDRDFNLRETFIECTTSGQQFSPEEFEIVETYRFEGETNPSDESVIYAIQSKDGVKGTLVNAFGPYADGNSDKLIAKLRFQNH
jgi:peptidoglycan hydrolase-like protein with peptidoglycan-binding domain